MNTGMMLNSALNLFWFIQIKTLNSKPIFFLMSWSLRISWSAKRLLMCDFFLEFKMYLTEQFCNKHILFMPGSVDLLCISYSICLFSNLINIDLKKDRMKRKIGSQQNFSPGLEKSSNSIYHLSPHWIGYTIIS